MVITETDIINKNHIIYKVIHGTNFFVRVKQEGVVSWLSDDNRFDELESLYQKTLREKKLKRILG